jgi:phage terminase large subunit-like protein
MAEGLVSPVQGAWTTTRVTFTPAQSGSAAVAVYLYNSGWAGNVTTVYHAVDNFRLAAEPNLINGSFEQGAPYSPTWGAITGWGHLGDSPAGAGSAWGRTPTDGSYLSMIGGTASWNAGRFTSEEGWFSLTAGRKYVLSFDALGHGAFDSAWGALPWEQGKMNLYYMVQYKGGPSNNLAMAEGLVSPVQGAWTTTSFTFTPAQSGSATVAVYLYNSGWAGNVWIVYHAVDNFKLAAVPPPKGTLIRFK